MSPIVWLMRYVFDVYVGLTGSEGLSIILLSFTFAALLLPFRKYAQTIELRISAKMKTVNEAVKTLKVQGGLRGEKLFLATEKIYKDHNYHPIHGVGIGLGFLVMLPVLISAIFLLTDHAGLEGQGFLFIKNLAAPDKLIGPINILPILMAGVTFLDAKIRFKNDQQSQRRFFVISAVLFLLVYNLPAGLVLYWIASNVFSMIHAWLKPSGD